MATTLSKETYIALLRPPNENFSEKEHSHQLTQHNASITCPSSLFSINIYKKSAKEVLLNLQSVGDDDERPSFLL